MTCPKCGNQLFEGALFCTRCGERVTTGRARDPLAESVETVGSEKRGGARGDEASVVNTQTLRGQVLDGKYELREQLGEGAMGAVYRARRVHIGDEVAVKILHPKYIADEAAVARFRREARAAAQLNHAHVVTIHDYGETESGGYQLAYIVMELVAGESLRELLRREGRLSPRRAVSLMRDICAGVAAAHRRGIVHRDIKPDNIIVLAPDDDRERESVMVVDFGIAKLRDQANEQTLTVAGDVVGTPYYMSPEQCLGESLDSRADVYSLGALLYEMLAGSPPFTAATATGIISKHLSEPPPPLPARAGASVQLGAVIHRALAKDPNRRQRDASELARELIAADAAAAAGVPALPPTVRLTPDFNGSGAPIAYAPASAPPEPPRRSRAPLVLGLAFLCLIVLAGAGVGVFFFLNANNSGARPNANANRPAQNANARGNQNSQSEVGGFARAEAKILNDAALADADLRGIDQPGLRLLVNTIFARHGRPFQTPDLNSYFQSRPWYRQRADFNDRMLTDADRANLRLLRSAGAVGVEPAPTPTPTPSPVPDAAVARREVSAALEGWAASTRARDLDAHVGFYADTLDTYYNARAVGSDRVRTDRARAFERYRTLDMRLSNVQINFDPAVSSAQVTLDKAWLFQGERCSAGKVQQQLTLARLDGRWRITGEKDLFVYPDTDDDCD